MLLIIGVTVLVLAITGYQVLQGLYSALIMSILTIACAAISMTFFEPAAAGLQEWLASMEWTLHPFYAEPVMLIVLFVVPLMGLRLLFDWLVVPANVVFGVWGDRIGGGALGLVSAQLLVGMFALAVQMLPAGQGVLGYVPYDEDLQRRSRLYPFQPDAFTIGMMDMLSQGSMSAQPANRLTDVHGDWTLRLFAMRNTAMRNGAVVAPKGSLKELQAFAPRPGANWLADVPDNARLRENQPSKVLVLRVGVDELARNPDDKWFRLVGTHFALVGNDNETFLPVGYLIANGGWTVVTENAPPEIPTRSLRDADDEDYTGRGGPGRVNMTVLREWSPDSGPKTLFVDWVYRVPEDFEPDYLIFRRTERKLVGEVAEDAMPKASGALSPAPQGNRRR
jgi:hypothetical protein